MFIYMILNDLSSPNARPSARRLYLRAPQRLTRTSNYTRLSVQG